MPPQNLDMEHESLGNFLRETRVNQGLDLSAIADQTKISLKNLQAVVEAAGASMEKIVQVVIYLTDMNDFHKMNEVYASYFDEHLPARATVGVAALAKGALVEIQAIAAV